MSGRKAGQVLLFTNIEQRLIGCMQVPETECSGDRQKQEEIGCHLCCAAKLDRVPVRVRMA